MGDSTRRKLLFSLLYATEGAPIGFLWKGLVPHMRDREFDPAKVGTFLAVILLPWTWKFLWAPLVDALRGPRWGYRAWVFTAQIAMGLALMPLAWLDLQADFGLVLAFCVAHAFCASTQDVAIDGLAISITPKAELGAVNAWMTMGKYVGRSIFGAATLLLLAGTGLKGAVPPVCGMIWGIGLIALWTLPVAEPPLRDAGTVGEVWLAFLRDLWDAVRTRATLYGVLFAATAGAAFEALGNFLGYILKDRGYADQTIAFFWFPVEPACIVAGALAGGWIVGRVGLRRGVAFAHLALTATVALVAVGTDLPGGAILLLVLAGAYYVAYGWFLTGSYALFMGLTRRAVAATQFTVFMAMTNFCENWAAEAGGKLYRGFGPKWGFLALVPVSLAALPLLLFLRPSRQ